MEYGSGAKVHWSSAIFVCAVTDEVSEGQKKILWLILIGAGNIFYQKKTAFFFFI